MTLPRFSRKGEFYLVTRRTNRRAFLLRPDGEVRRIYFYCLAFCARKWDVDVLAVCIMSSHVHLVVFDRNGQISRFIKDLHEMVAHALKRFRKWAHELWETNTPTSLVSLLDENAVIDKVLYTEMNPVKAGICKRETQWPGLLTDRQSKWAKPDGVRNYKGMQEEETLRLVGPEGMTSKRWLRMKAMHRDDANKEARALARAEAKEQGRAVFRGVKRAMQIDPRFEPETPSGAGEKTPRFASRNKDTLERAYKEIAEFYAAYFSALRTLKERGRAKFPLGTWKMAIQLGQRE